jgi:hypothetical protein
MSKAAAGSIRDGSAVFDGDHTDLFPERKWLLPTSIKYDISTGIGSSLANMSGSTSYGSAMVL